MWCQVDGRNGGGDREVVVCADGRRKRMVERERGGRKGREAAKRGRWTKSGEVTHTAHTIEVFLRVPNSTTVGT